MAKKQRQSVSTEDYLKAIYRICGESDNYASTNQLAEELEVSAPSVSGMIRKLADNDLVDYSPYNGARLTEFGRQKAVKTLRRHRLVELFLQKCLKMDWDEIHEEAEVLEHALSERLEARIDEWLGHPRFDPHGAPIPDAEGHIAKRNILPLSELDPRRETVIAQVVGKDAALLSYFKERRILPNRRIVVLERGEFGDSLKVRVSGRVQFIGLEAANQILVERV